MPFPVVAIRSFGSEAFSNLTNNGPQEVHSDQLNPLPSDKRHCMLALQPPSLAARHFTDFGPDVPKSAGCSTGPNQPDT